MFFETGKKFVKLFSEITNQKSTMSYRNVADDVLLQKHLQIWIILIGFRDPIFLTSVFANMNYNSPAAAIAELLEQALINQCCAEENHHFNLPFYV